MTSAQERRYDAVFFDAGNTLLTMDYDYLSRHLATRPVGLTATADDLERAEIGARPELSEYLSGKRSTESGGSREVYLRLVLSSLDWPKSALTSPALADLVDWLGRVEVADQLWSVVPEPTVPLLVDLAAAGMARVVVSNSDGEIHRRLDEAGLSEHFEVVVDSGRLGAEKPDPRIFTHAAEAVGCAIERCLHVGDIYHVDVVGATAAGATGVLIDPWSRGRFGSLEVASLEGLREIAGLGA